MALRVNVTVRLGRAERREVTRRDLLDAAARVFAAKGFAGASVDDVAEAAGFTKGAVYSNFASKTDLMIALIKDRVARQAEDLEKALADVPAEDPVAELEAQTCGPASFDREWVMLVGEFMLYAMRDERARAALAAEYERARRMSADLIARRFVAAGVPAPLPPRDLAILLESLGIGIGFQVLIDPEGVSLDLQREAVERILAPRAEPQPPTGSGERAGAALASGPSDAGDLSGS